MHPPDIFWEASLVNLSLGFEVQYSWNSNLCCNRDLLRVDLYIASNYNKRALEPPNRHILQYFWSENIQFYMTPFFQRMGTSFWIRWGPMFSRKRCHMMLEKYYSCCKCSILFATISSCIIAFIACFRKRVTPFSTGGVGIENLSGMGNLKKTSVLSYNKPKTFYANVMSWILAFSQWNRLSLQTYTAKPWRWETVPNHMRTYFL